MISLLRASEYRSLAYMIPSQSVEKVSKVMRRQFYMDSVKAREFGVIDKVHWDC